MPASLSANSLHPPKKPIQASALGGLDYKNGFALSLIIHGVLFTAVVVKSLVFPGKMPTYIPSLRVDIVGLPDILKKDLKNISQIPAPPAETADKAAVKRDAISPTEKDEMVLKPKQTKQNDRQQKLKGALARIRALEKISSMVNGKHSSAPTSGLIKGNAISKGTSLSGEAKESAEASYFDHIKERLQENWTLPVWLARQNFSAQVKIYIDSRGRIRSFRFIKPSGNQQFDNAVNQTIQESQPYPVPPGDLAGSLLIDGILIGFPL
ncbi:MAG: TonB family protein [Bdellovibrionota bacterium]